MNELINRLSNGLENIYAKANNISIILNSYNTLIKSEDFYSSKSQFVNIVKILQDDLIDDIDAFQNDILKRTLAD